MTTIPRLIKINDSVESSSKSIIPKIVGANTVR